VWDTIHNQRRNKGRFSEEEDEIIIQSVVENVNTAGSISIGLWLSIAKKLDRNRYSVYKRWKFVLSKDVTVISRWNDAKKKSE